MDRIRKIPPGTVLFREGESGDYACLVRAGIIELLQRRLSDQVPFATVFEGQIFGELALIDRAPRMATARAGATACEVAIIDRARFVMKLQGLPPKQAKLFKVFADYIRETPVWPTERVAETTALGDGRANAVASLIATFENSTQMRTGDLFIDLLLERLVYYAKQRLPNSESREPKASAL